MARQETVEHYLRGWFELPSRPNLWSSLVFRNVVSVFSIALLGAVGSSAIAAPTYFAARPAFSSQLGSSVTDDYSNPGYIFIQNNSAMSAVLGETDYRSTGFTDWNIVSDDGKYCAGCNGSFELSFTTTSVGDANGVFGVGLDVQLNNDYFAFVTFGDGSTDNVQVLGGNFFGFFGLTSPQEVKSIHFGLTGGGSTQIGYLQIDNLTIGAAGAAVPEPTTTGLVALALLGLAATRRKPAAR